MKKLKKWKGLIFVLPSLIGVFIFYIIPFISSAIYCFTTGVVDRKFVGFANFIALFHNEAYSLAVKNTCIIMGIALPLLCTMSIILALVIEKNLNKYRSLQGWLLISMAVPTASMVLVWRAVFETRGVLNGLLGTNVDWLNSDYAPFIVVGLIIWKNLGYDILLITSSLLTLPREYEEAASVEGANGIRIALWIKLPLLVPMLFFMGIISLLNCLKIFREVYLLQGDYPNKSIYMLQHFMNNNFKNLNYEMLTTAAFILYIVIFTIIYFMTRWQQRYTESVC